jgi:hypothetical protein
MQAAGRGRVAKRRGPLITGAWHAVCRGHAAGRLPGLVRRPPATRRCGRAGRGRRGRRCDNTCAFGKSVRGIPFSEGGEEGAGEWRLDPPAGWIQVTGGLTQALASATAGNKVDVVQGVVCRRQFFVVQCCRRVLAACESYPVAGSNAQRHRQRRQGQSGARRPVRAAPRRRGARRRRPRVDSSIWARAPRLLPPPPGAHREGTPA